MLVGDAMTKFALSVTIVVDESRPGRALAVDNRVDRDSRLLGRISMRAGDVGSDGADQRRRDPDGTPSKLALGHGRNWSRARADCLERSAIGCGPDRQRGRWQNDGVPSRDVSHD